MDSGSKKRAIRRRAGPLLRPPADRRVNLRKKGVARLPGGGRKNPSAATIQSNAPPVQSREFRAQPKGEAPPNLIVPAKAMSLLDKIGASEKDALEKLKYDLFYIKNMSFVMDLMVIFHTAKIVLLGRGSR